jgi:hypothetical protein
VNNPYLAPLIDTTFKVDYWAIDIVYITLGRLHTGGYRENAQNYAAVFFGYHDVGWLLG